MNEATDAATAKDPICGVTVDPKIAIHADHDGKKAYFYSDHCRAKFLSMPAETKPEATSGSCCR